MIWWRYLTILFSGDIRSYTYHQWDARRSLCIKCFNVTNLSWMLFKPDSLDFCYSLFLVLLFAFWVLQLPTVNYGIFLLSYVGYMCILDFVYNHKIVFKDTQHLHSHHTSVLQTWRSNNCKSSATDCQSALSYNGIILLVCLQNSGFILDSIMAMSWSLSYGIICIFLISTGKLVKNWCSILCRHVGWETVWDKLWSCVMSSTSCWQCKLADPGGNARVWHSMSDEWKLPDNHIIWSLVSLLSDHMSCLIVLVTIDQRHVACKNLQDTDLCISKILTSPIKLHMTLGDLEENWLCSFWNHFHIHPFGLLDIIIV